MEMRRLTIMSEGREIPWPLARDEPVLTSAFDSWSGFSLEYHTSREILPRLKHAYWPRMQIALVTKGYLETWYKVGAKKRHHRAIPGRIFVNPRGFEIERVHPSGTFELLLAEVNGPIASQLEHASAAFDTNTVVPQQNINDAQVSSLIRAMHAELRDGCPTGRVYTESLSMALGSYILSHFRTTQCPKATTKKLSEPQRRRVIEFIEDGLDGDLSLIELARITHLSPRHFARLFKNTFHESPHQYVMRSRLRRAETLLSLRDIPISEVALSAGFGNQSHFTSIFHRKTGLTPNAYRNRH